LPSASELAERLRDGAPVRIAGGGTKAGWGHPVDGLEPLSTSGLDRIVDHAAGDFTAVLEAGVPLAQAQEAFGEAGQQLALDPPDDGATIGGLVATGDSGPLRHRYGAPRDLVIGVTLALADGTVAHGGGRVIKNVAGYDLPKLAAGSFGSLGVITQVAVRLHPKPEHTATAILRADSPAELQRIALDLHAKPLEADALDVRWADGEGAVLVRFGGAAPVDRVKALGATAELVDDDSGLWAAQRAGQRATATSGAAAGSDDAPDAAAPPDGTVVLRVAALPSELARVLGVAADHGGTVVGRAGVGASWLRLPPGTTAETVADVRARLSPHPVVVTDAPAELRAQLDPWGVPEGAELDLMRAVKARFDPDRKCNPGLYVGRI
jgi:glycolate oxidase FAD binding subunit